MANVHVLSASEAAAGLLADLRQMLDDAFEGRFSDHDWGHCLGGWLVLITADGAPVSHAAVVPRALDIDGRQWRCGYVEGVGTAPHRQREGLGSTVMQRVGRLIADEFEVGALSTGYHTFYERHGWERWRGPTFVRRKGQLLRTTDEDDAIMVLRFGPSRNVDLADPIACDERDGDDW